MTGSSSDGPPGFLRPGRRGFLAGAATLGLGMSTIARPTRAASTPASGATLVVGQYQEPTVYDPNHQ